MNCNEIFRKNVITLRRQQNLTKEQMAKILGISVQTLSRLEAGERVRMNAGMLVRFCDRFDLSADDCLLRTLETVR